jgi:uncharacterized protein DUF6455
LEEIAMTAMQAAGNTRTVLDRLGDWWRKRRERATTLAGLRSLDDAELSNIAQDIGVGTSELVVLAGKWPDAANLMERRAAALGVDTAEIKRTEPHVMRDLARVCSICGNKRTCEHDLDRDPADPAWKEYCPNVSTFAAIRNEPDGKLE